MVHNKSNTAMVLYCYGVISDFMFNGRKLDSVFQFNYSDDGLSTAMALEMVKQYILFTGTAGKFILERLFSNATNYQAHSSTIRSTSIRSYV